MEELPSKRRKIVILTGPPSNIRCETKDGKNLRSSSDLNPAFQRFIGELGHQNQDCKQQSGSQHAPKWRAIRLGDVGSFDKDAQYRSPPVLVASDHLEQSEFLQHSIAVCNETTGKVTFEQLEEDSFDGEGSTKNQSFCTVLNNIISFAIDESTLIEIPGNILGLKALPNAQQFKELSFLARRANVLVAVISKAPVRDITVRKSGQKMSLVEILVGDETRAGFTITFWLPMHEAEIPETELGYTLNAIRGGDLLLLENMGLCEFRSVIHGQSLNTKIWKSGTTVRILGRNGQIQANLSRPLRLKALRVQGWTRQFLGPKLVMNSKQEESLPPDTLEEKE